MIPLTQGYACSDAVGYGYDGGGRFDGDGSGDGPFSVLRGDGIGCGHDDDGYRGRNGGDGYGSGYMRQETSPLVFAWVSIEASA